MKKNIFFYLTVLFITICITSCNLNKEKEKLNIALKLADQNKTELQKVLDHYQSPKDSLKLKAAIFLISNMPYYSWLKYDKKYNHAFRKAGKIRKQESLRFEKRKQEVLINKALTKKQKNKKVNYLNKQISIPVFDTLTKEINSLENNNIKPPDRIYDVKHINAAYLIENIELAFKVYNNNSLKLCHNFNQFLEYILPYKVLDEPLERGKRKELFNKYRWAIDSLKVKPTNEVVTDLHYSMHLSTYTLSDHKNPYYGIPSLSQFEETRFGSCEQLATYIVNVLRSIGIPSGIDYSQRWGNYYLNNSHSWVFYLEGNNLRTLDVGGLGEDMQEHYHQSSITKVYRNTFSKPEKCDVTEMYHKTEDVAIDILWNVDYKKTNNIYLGIFNPKSGWDKIASVNEINNNKAIFKKVGTNLIYVAFFEKGEEKYLVNYPFELDEKGKIHYLKADKPILEKAKILRKYPIVSYTNNKAKIEFIKSPNGCILQGRNNEDSPFEDIYKIQNFYSSHEIDLPLDHPVTYKYYRFLKPKLTTSLATFHLLDNSSKIISNYSNVRFKKNKSNEMYNKLIDNNPLSFVSTSWLVINYSFDKPTEVSGIKLQAKNDDNHINKNELYELLYWDKKWISLGERKANDTVLYYNNIPKNALYWLKNNTKGNEEFVFKFNEHAEQVWVGAEIN